MSRKTPSKPELERAVSDATALGQAEALMPSWKEVQQAFPEGKFVPAPEGKRDFQIEDKTPDKRRLRQLEEMFAPANRVKAEVGQTKNGRTQEIVMKDPRGGVRHVPIELEERVARKTGARRIRLPRFPGLSSWCDRQGRWWIKGPKDTEWRPIA